MEYLAGGSLADQLKRTGRLDPNASAELVATLAGAVQAAHDLGIVHRDLKPANVLYDEHGQPKVTDFGLAKRAGRSDLTATHAVMGTPAYMAPEQARGDTKFVGPQADVYSLGVILYECLSGSRPFQHADPLALLRKVEEEEPERPGKRVPGLPRDVELMCLKCLAKDPAERYPTARALAADLGRFAAGEPVSVRAAGVVERAAKWARREPELATVYAIGLLAGLLSGFGSVAV
jgi:serine/threonine protein kinase